jgi:preprotein translocase subunit YajC
MLITPAYAQAAGAGPGGGFLGSLIPLVLIFVIFYFLLIRPQQKRVKEHKNMVDNLRRGDRVVTGGGIVGEVKKVKEGDEVEVEIAKDVVVKVYRSTITTVLSKTEPAKDS